jgi:sec-independent protein translocase protein TatB
MFDIGWPELLLVMVIALIVIGPKELPNAIRTVMMVVRKLRGAAREFQSGLDDIARESGVDDIKRQIDDIDFYDPGEALKSIADSDSDLLGLDNDPDLPAGNSILDDNNTYTPPEDNEAPHGDAAGPFDTTPADSTDAAKADEPAAEASDTGSEESKADETKPAKSGDGA